MSGHAERYQALLAEYLASGEEGPLAAIADLGRALVQDAVPPEDVVDMHQQALSRLAPGIEALGLERVVEATSAPLLELMMAYGLAFRRQLELQFTALLEGRLAEAQRLEAIGTLAAGIAHDFNNILGVIMGYAGLLEEEVAAGTAPARYLEAVLLAAGRGRDLVRRILQFAREGAGQARDLDLVEEVREAVALLRVTLPPLLRLDLALGVERLPVHMEPGHAQQLVLNLASNAVHAMRHATGTLAIGLDRVEAGPGPGPGEGPPGLPPGPCARLKVRDNGTGMTPEVRRRLFEPFFTTKPVDQGTGLGLSVVHGIVTGYGGAIDVWSEPGLGTELTLYLPCLLTDPPPGSPPWPTSS